MSSHVQHPPLRIAIIAFDGISAFHLSVPLMVFGENWEAMGIPRCDVYVCAVIPGQLNTSVGLGLTVPHGLDVVHDADIVIVPSWHQLDQPYPPALLAAVKAAHEKGAEIVGLCLGAFVLAEAGLLAGRRATTHWAYAARFAKTYPDVLLDATVLYAQDGTILTSAGTAASLDCCLHFMSSKFGAEAAQRLANRLVVAPHRSGGQAQFIERTLPELGEQDRIGMLVQWLEKHFTGEHTLDSLAQRAMMSKRSFSRHFSAAVGTTPIEWINTRRVTYAQRLLETTDLGIDAIAQTCGFNSTLSLRKHFSAVLRMSPSAYRAQYGDGAKRTIF